MNHPKHHLYIEEHFLVDHDHSYQQLWSYEFLTIETTISTLKLNNYFKWTKLHTLQVMDHPQHHLYIEEHFLVDHDHSYQQLWSYEFLTIETTISTLKLNNYFKWTKLHTLQVMDHPQHHLYIEEHFLVDHEHRFVTTYIFELRLHFRQEFSIFTLNFRQKSLFCPLKWKSDKTIYLWNLSYYH